MSHETEEGSIDLALLAPVFEQHPPEREAVVSVLLRAQELYGCLPGAVLERVAERLHMPSSEVYGVATFYPQFRSGQVPGHPAFAEGSGYTCHEEERVQWIPNHRPKYPGSDHEQDTRSSSLAGPGTEEQSDHLGQALVTLPDFTRTILMEEIC